MGQPTKNKGTKRYNLYPQQVKGFGSVSGIVILDMSHDWSTLILSGDITSIDTSNDLPADKRGSFTILVTQDSGIVRSIDWLSSGKFISSKSSTELQPNQTLNSATRYSATWNGSSYELLIDKV